MISILFVLIIPAIRPVSPNRIAHEGNTALAIKQGIQNYTNAIPPGISDFTELTRKSKIFLDNTLICKEVLECINKTIIFSPGQWGKTTTLTLLQSFLEIQVDQHGNKISPKESTSNYKLFKLGEILHQDGTIEQLQTPLLIADQHETMMNYQGEYPVIYVTFKDAIGQNSAEIQRNLSLALHRAYKRHEYMIEKWKNPSDQLGLQKFKDYLQKTLDLKLDLGELWSSLIFLGKNLEIHFGKKSYLLIDDFDTPLRSWLSFEHFPEIDEQGMYCLLDSTNTFLGKSSIFHDVILTATFNFKFSQFVTFQTRNIIDNQLLGEDHPKRLHITALREYFGFKEPQVQFLFDKHNITWELAQQAKLWYNGYQSDILKFNFYNPASIVQFLFHKKIACYRPLKKYNAFISKMLNESPQMRKKVLRLLSKVRTNGYSFNPFGYGPWDRKRYHQHFRKSYSWRPLMLSDIFEIILHSEDYLIGEFETQDNILANNEVAFLMSTWLIAHYTSKFHINYKLLDTTANALLDFIETEHTIQPLKESLEGLHSQSVLNVTRNQHDEDSAHAVLNCVALKMQCLSKFRMDIYYDNVKRADLVLYDHPTQCATVLQLRENQTSTKSVLDNATECAKDLELPDLKISKIQIIAINIFANKSIDILTETTSIQQ